MRTVVFVLLFCSVIPVWAQSHLPRPSNVNSVFVKARTETELTLQWNKINNFNYTLRYSNGTETPLTVSTNVSVLTHTVTGLAPGTRYTFTMYTLFKGVKSSGFNFTAVTTPSNIVRVSVKARSETAVTLEWNKVSNSNSYIYILRQNNRTEEYTPMYWGGSVATHTVSSLSPGSKYSFTIYTVFGGERSSGYNFSVVTRPSDVERVNVTQQSENSLLLSWKSVDANNISYILRYSNGTEVSVMELDKGSVLTYVASSLAPGTKYKFTLYTVFEDVKSRGLVFTSATASFSVTGLHCERLFGGTVLILIWNAPTGPWTEVEVHMKGRRRQYTNESRHEFHGLMPAFWYYMTLKLHSEDVKTVPVSIRCQTDPRVVIIAAIFAILFIVFLVCLGVCIHRKRKSQTDRTSVPDLEEDPCNAPVRAKPRSPGKKQRGQGSSQEKSIRHFQNPYSAPRVP